MGRALTGGIFHNSASELEGRGVKTPRALLALLAGSLLLTFSLINVR